MESTENKTTKQQSLSRMAGKNFMFSLLLFLVLIGIIFTAFWRDRENMQQLGAVYEDQFMVEQFKASLINILSPLNEFALGGASDKVTPLLKQAIADYQASYARIENIGYLGDAQRKALLQVHNLMSEVMNIADDVANNKITSNQADQVIMLAQNLLLKAQDKLELIVRGMEQTLEETRADHESQASLQLYMLLGFIVLIVVLVELLNRKLLAKAQEVSRASSSVAMSADDILSANEEQANATGQQSRFIERVVKGLDLVADSGAKLQATATGMEKNIQNTVSLAKGGSEEVDALLAAADSLQGQLDDTASHTALGQQEIEHALKSLDRVNEVAEEAQLLAVNASIETSDAGSMSGEVQRIADEVKQLSEDVRAALMQLREQGEGTDAGIRQALGGVASSRETSARLADLLEKAHSNGEKAGQAASIIVQVATRQNDRNQKILQALNYISELLHISGNKLQASREASMRLSKASASLQDLS